MKRKTMKIDLSAQSVCMLYGWSRSRGESARDARV
jgi:hypothetical protein